MFSVSDLLAIARHYDLDVPATRRLWALAGLDAEPAALAGGLPRVLAALAAVCVGLGAILWVAANWEAWGRLGQFALLQGLVASAGLGALWWPRARPALALLMLLSIGGLLAYFGQTYQTGADPWSLFAGWALLALPLALAVRSDLLWTPWALVAMTAIALWVQTQAGGDFGGSGAGWPAVHAWGWGMAALIVGGLGPGLRRFTGAGIWARRTAATLAVALVSLAALGDLLASEAGAVYGLGLVVLGLAALGLVPLRTFEIGILSAVLLGLDTLLVAGLGRWLLDGGLGHPELIGSLFFLGLAAALVVAASVSLLLRLARRPPGARR